MIKKNKIECPCETCLVRVVCKYKIVRKGSEKRNYLVVELAERCPEILKYFGVDPITKRVIHEHEKIYKLCKIHGTLYEDANYFCWLESNIGIYQTF